MTTIWISYSWLDNLDDVLYVAQELRDKGLNVKIDRWTLEAGQRLWPQIEHHIQDKNESDAWGLYATQNSLASERCREELAYALDRALTERGDTFPIVGIFPSSVERNLIPASIRTRLYVSLTDPDWKERIISGVEKRALTTATKEISPIFCKIYSPAVGGGQFTIEVRPRAGTWSPFTAGVPIAEKDQCNISLSHGAAGKIPITSILMTPYPDEAISNSGEYWLKFANNPATPTESYYIHCDRLPTRLLVGVWNGTPAYVIDLTKC